MISAFVLIECDYSHLVAIKSQLTKIGHIHYLYQVSNTHDIILKLSASNKKELRDKVTEIVRMKHIRSATSLIIVS